MAPTLRSNSAQNSPTAAGKTSNNDSPSNTPRKAPQCSKCKRPRAGHPRSGCPFVDSPSRETKAQDKTDNHLTVALGSMTLLSPVPIEPKEDKAFIRNRRRLSAQPELVPSDSLRSLSTNSSEIVMRLLQPGIFDDTDEDDNLGDKGKISKVVRWKERIPISSTPNTPLKIKTPARSPMPGSLFPPTPESSFASTRTSDVEEISVIIRRSNIAVANPPVADDVSSHSTSTVQQRALPLARSMSVLQREMFMSELKEAKATLCVFDKTDIAAMYAKAVACYKFVFQVMNNDKNDSQALLVVGQDEEAVYALLRQVEAENERAKAKVKEVPSPKQSHNLGMAAGGIVVGAVGAWAGLAFS
ncbi:hypothetical protein BYT27DRAFT_7141848 [Phlegmacium glaucopus]|nr:hypothetical protein BYT27DRAFT_7141848 [Phlegmacium glaucopus]